MVLHESDSISTKRHLRFLSFGVGTWVENNIVINQAECRTATITAKILYAMSRIQNLNMLFDRKPAVTAGNRSLFHF